MADNNSKILILGDTHFGGRNDNQNFTRYIEKFYKNVLFPYMNEHKIDTIIQVGDVFDRRKYINFVSLYRAQKMFFDIAREQQVNIYTLVGNHDIPYRNTLQINSPTLLLAQYQNVTIIDQPQTITIKGTPIAFIPWICEQNTEATVEQLNSTDATIVFGHLELIGFEMHKGAINQSGNEKEIFKQFEYVFTGHFHHKSQAGNIYYVGAPYQMTWGDYNDARGFHTFDLKTKQLEYIENHYQLFYRFTYDDVANKPHDLLKTDFNVCKDKYVKVVIRNKTNPQLFDIIIANMEKSGALDVQVVDDHYYLDLANDIEIIDEVVDTLTALKNYVDTVGVEDAIKHDLIKLFTELYNEAGTIEN